MVFRKPTKGHQLNFDKNKVFLAPYTQTQDW